MISLFRKVQWWLQRRRKEEELREELQFHLAEEMEERRADGLPDDEATWAARRDLGNTTLLREDARTLWSWVLLEQLAQDVRYGLRGMFANRMFTGLAALSLALGIGANTAIYSFMDAILLRSLPVADPASLIVVKWHSRPVNFGSGDPFVMHSMDGRTDRILGRNHRGHLSVSRVRASPRSVVAGPVQPLRSQARGKRERDRQGRGRAPAGPLRVRRLLPWPCRGAGGGAPDPGDDDRAGAAPVAVLSAGYSQRRFGDAARAIGQAMLVNSVTFTVIGVAPPEFFGVDPASAPQIYLPMRDQPSAPTRRRARVSRPELLLGRDDGPAEARRRPGACPGRARGAVRAVGRLDGDQRWRARQPSRVAPRGGRGRARQPEAPGTRSRSMCCWRWSG